MKVFRKFTFMFVAGFLPERFPRRRTRRMFAAAACLLALGFVLLLGAGAAQAQAPVPVSAEVALRGLTVTFDRALRQPPASPIGGSAGRPDGRAFTVEVTAPDGGTRTLTGGCSRTSLGTISGRKVSVTLCGPVYHGETARVSYDRTKASNSPSMLSVGTRLAGVGYAEVASFNGQAAANNTPDEFQPPRRKDRWPPTLQDVTVWGGGAPVSGSHLRLDFSERLNAGSVPDGRSFRITVNGERRHLFSGAPAHIQGATLRLWLNAVVRAGDRVEVSYTRASYHYADHYGPLRDLTGNLVEEFSARAASNAEGPPVLSEAEVDGTKLTVTLNEEIDPCCTGTWRVRADGVSLSVLNAATTVAGNTLTLTLGAPVAAGQRVRVSYLGGGVRDVQGNRLASFSTYMEVTNITAPPEFVSAKVNGTKLTLAFDEPLDAGSAPAPGDFYVTAGGARRNVAGVAIDGASVMLTLDSAVAWGESAVRVGYTRPASNPLRDRGGNEVASFPDQAVTNVRPPAFQSAQVTGKTLTVLFDQALDPRSVPHRSRFYVLVNGRWYMVVGPCDDGDCDGGVVIEGAKVTLTLEKPVSETDTVTVSYGKREKPLRDRAGNEVADFSKRPVSWVAGPPVFVSAEANGTTLALTFDQDLDGGSVPAPGRFHVSVDSVPRNVASDGVAIDGATVTLTLSTAVAYGETVKVRYSKGANPLRNAAGFAVASFGDQAVTNNSPKVPGAFWSATLTVGDASDLGSGCSNLDVPLCTTALTEDSFTSEGTSYQVVSLRHAGAVGSWVLFIQLDKAIPSNSNWTLHVGDRTFLVADATLSHSGLQATWNLTEEIWQTGNKVDLALTAANSGAQANSGPSFHSASVNGRQLSVTFDEPLDEDSAPDGGAFRVRTLPDGGGTGKRSAQGQGGTSSGTGATSVEGRTVTVTLDRPVTPGDRVFVSYDRPDENAIRDREGGEAEGFSARPAAHAPPVTAVAVVSDAGSDDTYALGDTIRVRVTFAEKVNVDTAGGTPRLTIKMDPGWGEFRAQYAGGSGTANLVFTHKVVEPNTSPRGIAVLANTLELNGGTIRSKATGADADLAHAGLGHDAKHKVNWRIQPSDVTAVAVVSDAGSDDTYALGDTIRVRVTFAGTVNVDTAGGTPRLKIKMDPTWGEFRAQYAGGSGTANLVFTHTVAKPNTSPRGIAVLANTLQTGGGAIRLAGTNANARLGHTGLGHDAAHKVNWRLSPPVASAPPGAPTGVTVTGASNTGLSVSWTAPSDTGSAAIAGYELRWHAGASDPANASDWTETGDVGAGTSATIVDLAADTAYRVQVRARGAGKGPWSSSGAGRTQAAGDTTPPVAESATVNWRQVTVTFDEDLVAVGAGEYLHYYFKVKGAGVEQHPVRATASGRTVTMELGAGSPARAGRSYTISYSFNSGNGPLKDAAGNSVVKFGGLAAENLTQPRLSVADAKAYEGTDASMDFAVTLDAAMDEAVTVDYATADGTATAGEDYTAASGTLTFAAGERRKTVSVAILDDAIDEGKETFRLRLSNAQGAVIEDGEATGTIINSDAMPRAWLARFGRAAAEHVAGAIGERLRASPGTRVTLGGQELDFSASANPDALTAYGGTLLTGSGPGLADGAPLLASANGFGRGLNERTGEDAAAPVREFSMPGLLLASSFHMASAGGGDTRASGRWSVWGRAARSSFEGAEGALTLEGDVTTATLGFDYERGLWLAGVALSRSSGEGSYEKMGMKGEVESGLTGVYPYARYNLSERLSVWGVVGFGAGDMTLEPGGAAASIETDIETSMAAGGARGVLLPARSAGGFELALRADLMATATASDATSNLAETEVETSRIRLLVEASRSFQAGDGSALAASVEAGLRYDGGDAETGSGLEAGGSLRWTSGSLAVEVAARGLMAHSEDEYEEWGVSGSVRYAQTPDGRGFAMRAGSTWGAAAGGAERLWSQRAAGLAQGEFAPGAGFDAEAGYGFGFRGGLLTPYTGVALSDAGDVWRAGARWKLGAATEVSLEASLRENAAGDDPESGVLLKGSRRW